MKRVLGVALLFIVVTVLSGCGETIHGMGEDLHRMGRGVKTVFVSGM